jgi:hypothetical protein
LADGLRVAVGYLAVPRQGEVPGGVHERASGKQSSAKSQQLGSRSLSRPLKMDGSLRACERFDVVSGDQICERPDQHRDRRQYRGDNDECTDPPNDP